MSTSPIEGATPSKQGDTPARSSPERGVDHHFYEDLTGFYREIDETLSSLQGDFLTEPTRKEQRLLLAISFLLLLVARGTIKVDGKQTAEVAGMKLAVDFGGTLLMLGALVCLFFLTTYGIRAYADWTSFSIRRARSEAQIEMISAKLDATWDGKRPKAFDETAQASRFRSRAAFDGTPVDWAQYNKEQSEYNRKVWGLAIKREWVAKHVTRVRRTRWLRFVFELLFPIVFGLVAVLEAYRRLGQ